MNRTSPPLTVGVAAEAARVPGAERRQLTVLFCDLVGSTPLAARLDPEDLREVMIAYLKTCGEVVAQFGGYVARYQGDGMLVYFGYPQAQEDAADRAVRASHRLVEVVRSLGREASQDLEVRVGVSTGLVVVGDLLGEGAAREEAVIGETPIIAARLQQAARPGTVLIADSTRRLLGRVFELEDLGLLQLKGFESQVKAWRLLSIRDFDSRFEGARIEAAGPAVGRNHELALLLDRWDSACAAEGQVVGLFGEAGIGKSRICAMLHECLADQPHGLVRLQCSPLHSSSALYPLIVHLERGIGLAPDQSPAVKLKSLEGYLAELKLTELLPLFAALLFIPTGEQGQLKLSAEELKRRMLDALIDWMFSLARTQPTLWILEDAHWVDPTTEEFVNRCIERLASAALLLVVTYRPEFRHGWTSHRHFTALGLNRLRRQQAAEMVRNIAAPRLLPAEVLDHIVGKTDGVPLFVEEFTKNVLESGLLHEEADRYVLSGRLPAHLIPSTLQDSLLARLDRLAAVKEVAQIAATIGREFSYRLLEALTPSRDGSLADALAQLVRADLLRIRGRPPEASYVFKHALVQEAAYSTLIRGKRQELHARIADVLQGRFPQHAESEPELVAYHYTEAVIYDRASEWWRKAGERALERSANVEAVNHFNKALETLKGEADHVARDERELELRSRLCIPLYITTGFASPEMEFNYDRMMVLSQRLGAAAKMLRVLWGQAAMTLVRSDLATTLEQMQRFMALAESAHDPNALIAGHRVLDYAHLARGDLQTARIGLQEVIGTYDRRHLETFLTTYDMSPVACAMCPLFLAVQQLGHLGQAAAMTAQAIEEAKRSGHPLTVAYVLYHVALFRMLADDPDGVRAVVDELLAVMKANDIQYWHWHCEALLGWTQAQSGSLDEGLARMRRGSAARQSLQANLWVPVYLTREADLLNKHRRFDEALQLLQRAETLMEELEQRYVEPELHRLRANALVGMQGPATDIEKSFQQALAIARRQQAKLWELRTAVSCAKFWQGKGRSGDARALLEPVYRWFTEGFDAVDLKNAEALLGELSQNVGRN